MIIPGIEMFRRGTAKWKNAINNTNWYLERSPSIIENETTIES
jgi:phage terminase large subunit-like protein